jgi:subtilisin family serine protease
MPDDTIQPGDTDQGAQKMRAGVISEAFFTDEDERRRLRMPTDDVTPMSVVVELNLFHEDGLQGSDRRFQEIYRTLRTGRRQAKPILIANTYYRCQLAIAEIKALVKQDQADTPVNRRAIYRVWPDFDMHMVVDRSVATIKADAARRSYDATGSDVVWAVIDSGIDGEHPHFATHDNLGGDIAKLHRDFTKDDPTLEGALVDPYGHGTHVAGIIAGALCKPGAADAGRPLYAGQRVAISDDSTQERVEPRQKPDATRITGVAPRCKVISLRVLNDQGRIRSTDVLRALEYVRVELNGHGKPPLRVHGVNISLGYEFNARWFACGQSPVCIEVDRLVRSGVVVVVAAGNTGYGELTTKSGRTSTGLSLTINDPGNSALAITVGATHRDSPHTYGVSYFSSKGPTGDGRAKPDLVAPGERVLSCAAGRQREQLAQAFPDLPPKGPEACYIDMSGTSMAAPHVSGAIAAFLSIRREFIGRPEDVKRIFLSSATSLGRERYFEGHGLVDLMRAIQSV